jgi:cation transport regulator ChaB
MGEHVETAITQGPDPTILTTELMRREITALRDVLDMRIEGQADLIRLLQASLLKRRSDIAEGVSHLQILHEEKFSSIQTQFTERDTRTEQTSRDSKVAVDAALQAAKEAVGEQNKSSALAIAKSEAGTTKQIDQIGVLITTTNNATNDKIDDLKQRITSVESRTVGHRESTGDNRATVALGISAIMAMVGIGAFVYHGNSTPATTAVSAPQPIIIQMPSTAPAPTTTLTK